MEPIPSYLGGMTPQSICIEASRKPLETCEEEYLNNVIELVETMIMNPNLYQTCLCALVPIMQEKFRRAGDLEELDRVVNLAEAAVASIPSDHPGCRAYIDTITTLLASRYQLPGHQDTEDLRQDADGTTSLHHPDRASYINDLGRLFSIRYGQLGEPGDLRLAVSLGEGALVLCPIPCLDRITYTNDLIRLFSGRYDSRGDPKDLNTAITLDEEVLRLMPVDDIDRPCILQRLVKRLWRRYRLSREIADLDRAIEYSEEILSLVPQGNCNQSKVLSDLNDFVYLRDKHPRYTKDQGIGIESLQEAQAITSMDSSHSSERESLEWVSAGRYTHREVLEHLHRSTERCREALVVESEEDSDIASRPKRALGVCLGTGDLQGLGDAITLGEEALATILGYHTELGEKVVVLGLSACYRKRYEILQDLRDLNRFIDLVEIFVEKEREIAEQSDLLIELGKCYLTRFLRLGDPSDLDHVIQNFETSEIAPGQTIIALKLFLCLDFRYKIKKNLDDLKRTIHIGEEILAMNSLGYHEKVCSILSNVLYKRYWLLEDLNDLERAVELAETVLEATSTDSISRISGLNDMCRLLLARYSKLGNPLDLDRIIQLAEEGLAIPTQDEEARTHLLGHLRAPLWANYKRSASVHDLDRLIELEERILARTPSDHPEWPAFLCNLSKLLLKRSISPGNMASIDRAIQLEEEALVNFMGDDSQRMKIVVDLAENLCYRGYTLGHIDDLEHATEFAEQVLSGSYKHNHRSVAISTSLTLVFLTRYETFKTQEEFRQAIRLNEEALDILPPDHPSRHKSMLNLVLIYSTCYHNSKVPEDNQRAIKMAEEGIAVVTRENWSWCFFASYLSEHLGIRYGLERRQSDLNRAITLDEEVIKELPIAHWSRPGVLSHLSSLLVMRYEELQDPQDRAYAIRLAKEAVENTAPDDLWRAWRLNDLGDTFTNTIGIQSTTTMNIEGLICYTDAVNCYMSPPDARYKGALGAFSVLLEGFGDSTGLGIISRNAIRLFPQVSPRYMGRKEQEIRLSRMSGFPKFMPLAASAIFCEFPGFVPASASEILYDNSKASDYLGLLEYSRGIIMGSVIDCRSDLSDLETKHPHLAQQFDRLRTEIDSPCTNEPMGGLSRRRRVQASDEMDETLNHIRELPGFEGFQLPPSPQQLMAMAAQGTIVLLNSNAISSHAMVVTDSDIVNIPLSDSLYEDAEKRVGNMSPGITSGKGGTYQRRNTYPKRNSKMTKLLLWLWDSVVEPVLTKLDFIANPPPGSDLPRIWWIGIGALSTAPFHAAGDHTPGSTRNTISHVVSSYTPTIKALSYAREKKFELDGSSCRLLLVSVPETSNMARLRQATQEVDDIARIVHGKASTTLLNKPSSSKVLQELPSYNAIHFACHGVSDLKSPSDSHLLLCNGSKSADKLRVRDISEINIKHAQLAYLSACHTASGSSKVLPDESIDIASGFQLAGFSHVLGTMWESNDSASQQVAGDFYKFLFDGEGGDQGHDKVSKAFHMAVNNLRREFWMQPLKWAPHIHMGA